jgi:hypothetical protein
MQRRDFLKAVLAGTTLAAGLQTVSASGIVNRGIPAEVDDKVKPVKLALKGFCTNDEAPASVNPLHPDWMYIEFGSWCWNMDAQYACKWGLHLLDMIPTAEDVAKAIQHPSYDGWWLTLNEPDLANVSPQAAATLVQAQMEVVLSVDPNAKFCVGMGSQMHAPFTSEPWFPAVWALIPANLKPSIRAFHTHYYVQCEAGLTHDDLFSPEPIRRYAKAMRQWLNKNANEMKRELWITEIGLAWNDQLSADPRVTLYPLVVQDAMNGTVDRWAWYSQSTDDGYATLCEPYSSKQTALGQVFSAMQAGLYPIKQK